MKKGSSPDSTGSSVELVVVGSIGLDTIETPFETREEVLGGSVSYACAAASFFTRVGMVGIVGSDFPGEFLVLYDSLGIDISGLQRETGRTFRWSGVYEADMINRRTLSTELNVFETFSPELPAAYAEAPYFLLGNISPELQLRVLSQARSPRFVAADTMDLWINISRDALGEVISGVTMLTLNDSEARLLTGKHNLRRCAEEILSMGPEYVVIKKGEHGSVLFSRDGIFIVPAYPVTEVTDPTGAGDSFAGGFLGALAAAGLSGEKYLRRSLMYGSVVASFGVEAFSLERLSSLSRAEVDSRLNELTAMLEL